MGTLEARLHDRRFRSMNGPVPSRPGRSATLERAPTYDGVVELRAIREVPPMPYDLVVMAALVAHFAFLVYLAVGGFLAWRHPRTLVLHVIVVAWGVGSVVVGYPCPLTAVEQWARDRAGRAPLSGGGFIEHYLTGVVYPERYLVAAQALAGLLVVMSWVGPSVRRRAVRHSATGRLAR